MRGHVSAARTNNLLSQDLPELPGLSDGISVWTAARLDDLRRQATLISRTETEETFQTALFQTIDILGARSQRAQEINEPLTSVSRLHDSATYKLYLLSHDRRGVGILKVGVKKLFLTHPRTRQLVEVDPLCVLDFYVDNSCQRKGFGKELFMYMLEAENVAGAERLAIDRPSPKFISFLKKHYGLADIVPQVNHFAVFTKFFDNTTISERGKLLRPGGGGSSSAAATDSMSSHAKKDSPGAAYGGDRASGEFHFLANHMNDDTAPLMRVLGSQEQEGPGLGNPFGIRKVAPYQPPPPLRELRQNLYNSERQKSGGQQQQQQQQQLAAPPRLVPFAVHNNAGKRGSRSTALHDHKNNCNNEKGSFPILNSAFPSVSGSRERKEDPLLFAGRCTSPPYAIPPLNAPVAADAAVCNDMYTPPPQHRLSDGDAGLRLGTSPPSRQQEWRGENFRPFQSPGGGEAPNTPSQQQKQPPPPQQKPLSTNPSEHNNFYNGYGTALVVALSPVRTPERRSVGEAVGMLEENANQTPQRHQQRYAKSRATYNIITGERN